MSLKYIGSHAPMSAKPLQWHSTLALMKVNLIHKEAHDNIVWDVLSYLEEFQAMSVANGCQRKQLANFYKVPMDAQMNAHMEVGSFRGCRKF